VEAYLAVLSIVILGIIIGVTAYTVRTAAMILSDGAQVEPLEFHRK
jgi:hypothetical protein